MKSNGQVVEEFARAFLLAPELAGAALSEALKHRGYEISFKKADPPRIDKAEDHLYLWPMSTGEKGVPVI